MKKRNILSQPTRVSDLNYDDLYDQLPNQWDLKMQRMEARERHRMRHNLA